MPAWAHDLTYDECDAWRSALGLDWDALLRRAGVKSHKDVIKQRWNDGAAPRDRAKIRAALEEVERTPKGGTKIGAAILGLEEWLRVGEMLAGDPDLFVQQLERLRGLAETVQQNVAAKRQAAETDAALAAFRSPTPAPKKSRK